ncbi:MAG: AAA family ATPase [Marinobacterium sp.]|nr:AAA family ATPase [Marinobacterium sp.]
MYESFFGLTRAPFKITPDPQMFFGGGKRQALLEALIYTIGRGEGLVKVVGEVGSGKTTLLRKLAEEMRACRARLIYINSPNMPSYDMLLFICRELGQSCHGDEPRYQLVNLIQQQLLSLHQAGYHTVMLIDEAQAIPLQTLEEIRLLGNLETDTDKLLQIMLFGQPELDNLLSRPQARQIRDRITYSLQLEPFDCCTLQSYLNYRLRTAGYIGKDLFTSGSARQIYRHTAGYPRQVNLVADKILLALFAEGRRVICHRAVKKAVKEHSDKSVSAETGKITALVRGPGVIVPYWKAVTFLLLIAAGVISYLSSELLNGMVHKLLTVSSVDTDIFVRRLPASDEQLWQQRHQRLRGWLQQRQQHDHKYTLQLVAAPYSQVQDFISEHQARKPDGMLQLYGYKRAGQQMAVVLSGGYKSRESARAAMLAMTTVPALPYRPFVRSLADIQTELDRLAIVSLSQL